MSRAIAGAAVALLLASGVAREWRSPGASEAAPETSQPESPTLFVRVGDEDNDLYRNTTSGRTGASWIVFRLEDRDGGRSPLGTRVRVRASVTGDGGTAGWRTRFLIPATGYSSQNEPAIHFGLGAAEAVDSVEVRWPDGRVDAFGRTEARRVWRVVQGRGGGQPAPESRSPSTAG